MTTNFITPPDFVEDPNFTIVLIDVDPADVETLAFLCAGHDESFNVYLYKEDMNDLLYLNSCVDRSDAVIINTVENGLSPTKDLLADLPKAHHYGPKRFLNNARNYENVFDYFIQRANERKQQSADTL